MSSQNVLLGPLAKVKINNTRFGVIRGRLRVTGTRFESSDTRDVPRRNFQIALYMVEATISVQRQSDVRPHTLPLNIKVGDAIDLIIAPTGSFAPQAVYRVGNFLVESYEVGFSVTGSEPQPFEFSGVGAIQGNPPNPYFIEPTT